MITHDLVVRTGEWEDKEGETKGRWMNVGVVGKSDEGKRFALINPAINFAGFERDEGRDMVYVAMFEKDRKEQGATKKESVPSRDLNDDIPF